MVRLVFKANEWGRFDLLHLPRFVYQKRQLIVIKKTVIDSMIVTILIHKVSYSVTLAFVIEMLADCLRSGRIRTWKIWLDSYDSREEDVFCMESVVTWILKQVHLRGIEISELKWSIAELNSKKLLNFHF